MKKISGQTAIEYLLLFGIVAAAVLFAFKNVLPQVKTSSDDYYDSITRVIKGENPRTGINGGWCDWSLCDRASGIVMQYRTCECPTPMFNGTYCAGASNRACP